MLPTAGEEREKPLTAAPSGIIGLETALPLAVTNLVKEGHLTYVQLLKNVPEPGQTLPPGFGPYKKKAVMRIL